jgi:hypothetical protein
MKRFLYEFLLRLHPREFRERFAAEMMLNFEEAEAAERFSRLFDGFTSLLRQWFLRSAWWKLMAAVVCATLQMMLIFSFLWRLQTRGPRPAQIAVSLTGAQHDLSLLILCATASFVVLATMIALWVRSLVAGRLKGKGRRRYSAI